jgi:hypothetical protein
VGICSIFRVRYASYSSNLVTISWLFVIFGEHQAMAQLIAKRVLISPLINKDLPVRHPSPRSWQFCVRDPESPKVTKTHNVLTRFAMYLDAALN